MYQSGESHRPPAKGDGGWRRLAALQLDGEEQRATGEGSRGDWLRRGGSGLRDTGVVERQGRMTGDWLTAGIENDKGEDEDEDDDRAALGSGRKIIGLEKGLQSADHICTHLQEKRWTKGVSSPERSKAPPVVESNPVGSSSGSQAQGNTTALAVCKSPAALDVIPISAIPGLRKPTPSWKRPREGVTDDDFLPKKNKSEGIPVSLSPLTTSSGTQSTASAAASGEGEADRQKEPETSPAREKKVEVQKELDASSTVEKEAEEQRCANLKKMRESVQEPAIPQACPDLLALNALHFMEQAQQSLLTLTEEYLGGASGNYRAVVVLKENELAVRLCNRKLANGSMELAAERSRVKSLQEQIAIYKRGSQDLETQFDRLQAQISILGSKVPASEDKVGSLKTELVERESRVSKLENSLHDAKQEGAHLNDLVIKHIEAKRLILGKLEKERQTASELRSRMGELEKTIAAHQGEVAALTTRAEALYEEGKFDMQHCIYGAIQSGLPEHRSLDDFISYYGVVFIDLTISDSSSDSSSLAFPSLGAPTPELSSGPSLTSEQSVTSPLPREENHPHLPQLALGGALPGSSAPPNDARMEVSSGCPGTSRPQKRHNPHSGASRLVSGARPSSQGSPSPQQSYGQHLEEWGDYDMGGNRHPSTRREKDETFQDLPPPSA
ncbi:unnamed protein product [Cuscuta campestris]|uniref:Uncharacterized protein n=1 Tax=Cuscuta campestris TaxID=132261 RepID=A0A484LCA5_9ASTE|nr:unnamed protein product [Cuscuta campestris]